MNECSSPHIESASVFLRCFVRCQMGERISERSFARERERDLPKAGCRRSAHSMKIHSAAILNTTYLKYNSDVNGSHRTDITESHMNSSNSADVKQGRLELTVETVDALFQRAHFLSEIPCISSIFKKSSHRTPSTLSLSSHDCAGLSYFADPFSLCFLLAITMLLPNFFGHALYIVYDVMRWVL